MPTTPTLGLPYPAPSDTADVPRDMQALALALDGSSSMLPVGALFLWPLANVPAGALDNGKPAFVICNGQLVLAVDYPELAALLGQTGGNVTIPDLRDRLPIGASATRALGSTGGSDVLTEAQLPAHTHGKGTLATANAGSHAHSGYTDAQIVVPATHVIARNQGVLSVYVTGITSSPFVVPYSSTGVAWDGTQGSHSHGVQTYAAGDHGHVVNGVTSSAGAGATHLHPYLSLNYVMRAG